MLFLPCLTSPVWKQITFADFLVAKVATWHSSGQWSINVKERRRFSFKKKNIYMYIYIYKTPQKCGGKCGSLLLAPFPMTPAWNIDSNVWRCQRHLKTVGWTPPTKRWSRRQTKPETQTPWWNYSNYFWTLWSVLDYQFLDFLICVKNRLHCCKPLFCVFSVIGAESNSNAYGTQVPGFTVSIIYRQTYFCVCFCLCNFYRLKQLLSWFKQYT